MSARLLFDQNLSPKLVHRLSDIFPGSSHVFDLGLDRADDIIIWEFAKNNGFVIVTRDADYTDLSILRGFPPKIIWICRGNCPTSEIERLFREHGGAINNLASNLTLGIYSLI